MNESFATAFFSPSRIFLMGAGIAAFAVSWIVGKMLHRNILKDHMPHGYAASLIPFMASLVKNACVIIGLLAFAGGLGIDVSSIVQAIGLIGVGLSFILKDLLADVVSGFFILGYKPFSEGHELSLQLDKGFYKGKVTAIDVRYTTLENTQEKILIPNSFLFKQPVSITK